MEAATTHSSALLTRDGSVPATPAVTPTPIAAETHPIDGVVVCACCQRFPLIGERVVRHIGRRGSGWVCEPCEASGRGDRIGSVTANARVRSLGGAMNVRRSH